MTSKNAFTKASNPMLEATGKVTGMALGKVANAIDSLLDGFGLAGAGKEGLAFTKLAESTKGVRIQHVASVGTMPFAPEKGMEEPAPNKPSATNAFARGLQQGVASQAPANKLKVPKGPSFVPT
jgi:hypothetical protein